MKHLDIVLLSLISGIVSTGFAEILKLDPALYFLVGSAACYYSFGYAEALDGFWSWWNKQPKFKGFRYWIKVCLDRAGVEFVEREK